MPRTAGPPPTSLPGPSSGKPPSTSIKAGGGPGDAEAKPTAAPVVEAPPPKPEGPAAPLVKDFARTFITYAEGRGDSPREVATKTSILALHVVPHLGGKTVADVGPGDLDALRAVYRAGYTTPTGQKVEPTKNPKTIANRIAVITKLLAVAHERALRPNRPPKGDSRVRA